MSWLPAGPHTTASLNLDITQKREKRQNSTDFYLEQENTLIDVLRTVRCKKNVTFDTNSISCGLLAQSGGAEN